MKNFQAGTIALLVLALTTPFTLAQQGTGTGAGMGANKQEIEAKIQQMSQALQLTPQQKMQVAPILKQEIPQLQQIKNNTSLGPLQKGMQLKQVSQASDAKIMPILNPEQQQKFQAMREQERQQMMQKLENRPQ